MGASPSRRYELEEVRNIEGNSAGRKLQVPMSSGHLVRLLMMGTGFGIFHYLAPLFQQFDLALLRAEQISAREHIIILFFSIVLMIL